MAIIGWIDFSPADRNRVGTILDLLRPEGMVDELGMGTIRDAISNELFPGISTIQTRAKYFFIIPYILRDYQLLKSAHRRKITPAKYLENREYEIMWELSDKYNHEEGTGIIGITKYKPEKIIRRPSAIYWNGINKYRFIDAGGLPLDYFLKQAVNLTFESLISLGSKGEDEDSDDKDAGYENVFRIKVPYKKGWGENLDINLNNKEAEFFKDRIIYISKEKLISELLTNARLWKIYEESESFMDFASLSINRAIEGIITLNKNLKNSIITAHDFSEIMYGAHIKYNCILHKIAFKSNYFDEDFERWKDGIKRKMLDFNNFNTDKLLDYDLKIRPNAFKFIEDWWQLVKRDFQGEKNIDDMIISQEAITKGNKARLKWKNTEDAKEGEWIGLTYLDYRFNQAKSILKDIREGLNR